ncbi:MAG: aminotransferase class I/II-fold pyridoxal phosphate-dependent enzyme [Acidobacteriota bacterium]|nr:aminotransferase class I/II-fold pyridoxal phosphate-dependent enzyme [Acidobacteriota bacterium]MDH3525642.1 aminotransferase class I/II-fold pyridoxal phosphate-dependent enzyme [Acidobacteriota bacterium]
MSRPVRPARRTEKITYAVRDVVLWAEEAAAAGREILYLNIGDPNLFDFETPPHIVEATCAALRANKNGYAPSSGIREAREAIERDNARKGISGIVHTFVTTGSSEAIDLAMAALVDPGDNVLLPSPGYPLYPAVMARFGGEARPYALDEASGWQPDLESIRRGIDERTKALVVINPNNPTGSVTGPEVLRELIAIALEHDLVLFSDEIYDRLVFEPGSFTATASLSSEAKIITLHGLSKVFVAPGFRLGWASISGPADELGDYCEAIRKLERARLSANHPEQYAVAPALDGPMDFLAGVVGKLRARRDLVVERLNEAPGISCVAPQGAFYAFPKIEVPISDVEFCRKVVRETGVVIVPGSGFGALAGAGHFRLVFLPREDVLARALDRIVEVARALV